MRSIGAEYGIKKRKPWSREKKCATMWSSLGPLKRGTGVEYKSVGRDTIRASKCNDLTKIGETCISISLSVPFYQWVPWTKNNLHRSEVQINARLALTENTKHNTV